MNGTCIKADFTVLPPKTQDQSTLFEKSFNEICCYHLPALASTTISDPLANDFHSPIWFFDKTNDTAVLSLEQEQNGTWTAIETLDNDDFGTFFDYGFLVNRFGESAIGYKLQWKAVLLAHGEGCYRIACNYTNGITGNGSYYSFEFELLEYRNDRADMTTRIEWVRNGKIGDVNNDARVLDYSFENWLNCLRIPESFMIGGDGSYTRNEIKYQSGAVVWVQDVQVENYTFEIGKAPEYLHKYVKTEIFQADNITITDYCLDNPTKHISRQVRLDSDYSPNYSFGTPYAEVICKLKQAIQNLTHKRE